MLSPELSFITVNYRTPEHVDRLVNSIRKYPPPFPYEIIVVDNDSGDHSIDLISGKHPDITFIPLEKNIGFGGGNNKGALAASGRILVIINPDSVIEEESFANAVGHLDEHPETGIVGLRVINPDGMLEQTARGFPNASTGLFGRSTFLGKLAQKYGSTGRGGVAGKNLQVDPSKTEPYEVDWVAGTIMLISRICWEKIGGFDDDFFLYWEDADICFRAREAGFNVVYFPGAYIKHEAGASTSRNPGPAIRLFHESAYRYITKHISPGPSLLRGFAWCALNLRAAILIARTKNNHSRLNTDL